VPNKIENKKVLVTGGAGFIGSNLCERLLQQHNQVVCLDNFSTGKRINIESFLSNPLFQLIEGDIRNLADCNLASKGVDLILHQAALGSVPRSIDDPITTNEVNVSGFLNMLQASKNNGVKRFVYAASSSTYGDSTSLPKVEDKIGIPLSPYAVTKYVNELYAKVFYDLYGVEVIGLRYFNVFGKRQTPDGAYAAAIPKFIRSIINNEPLTIYGDGNQSRDFTYIENVIQANELAATTQNKEAIGTVFNVAYGEATSVNEVVEALRLMLSEKEDKFKNIQIQYAPMRKGEVLNSLASIEKAKNMLNYQPKYNFKAGLTEAIEWYWENLTH
jgi:UDP-N-acetylglucosamine/UDP-N-acetylgalactosamine 4-epimerase